MVSDSAGQSLFVLARDVETFKAQYDDEVQGILDDNGFSGYIYGPRETTQDGCSYIAPGTALGMAEPRLEDDCVKVSQSVLRAVNPPPVFLTSV